MTAQGATRPVLLCWDGSDAAAATIAHAGRLVGDGREAVVLFVHVPTEEAKGVFGGVAGPDAPIIGASDAEELVARGLALAREAGFDACARRVEARRKTAEIIVQNAEDLDASLIAMGQRRRSALGTLLLGSVARDVLNLDHRPVLLTGPSDPGPYPGGG